MPVFLPSALNQTAVYFALGPVDDYGQPSWGVPVEISVRWDDVSEEFVNSEGETRFSRSIVMVDRDLVVNGVLMLGALSTSVIYDDPKANPNAWEIKKFEKIPNFKGTKFVRIATL